MQTKLLSTLVAVVALSGCASMQGTQQGMRTESCKAVTEQEIAQLFDRWNQSLISGVGNIYADEALWRARLHPETPGASVTTRKAAELLMRVREVFAQALVEGGTSFDEQYVNVNGQAGYFAHSLNAYGRTGEPCPRCGAPTRRIVLGGRSSHFCPRCQRRRKFSR